MIVPLSKAACWVEVFTELSHHDVGCDRGHRTTFLQFLLPSSIHNVCRYMHIPIHNVLAKAVCC